MNKVEGEARSFADKVLEKQVMSIIPIPTPLVQAEEQHPIASIGICIVVSARCEEGPL